MPSRVRETTIFGPASIMLFRQIIHFGGRQWNSFSRITSTCVNLWATGSSSQIPNGPTIGIGFCWQITKEMRPCFSQIISLLIIFSNLVWFLPRKKSVWLELPIRRKLTNDSKYIWIATQHPDFFPSFSSTFTYLLLTHHSLIASLGSFLAPRFASHELIADQQNVKHNFAI